MAYFRSRPIGTLIATSVVLGLGLAGCVDSYGGSNLQVDFSSTTPLPAGTDPDGARAPADTYFAFYAVDNVTDANGTVTQSYLYEATRFEIKPEIDVASPCFIDVGEHVPFPGLHVTQFATKTAQAICQRLGNTDPTCFSNPFAPPSGATATDQTDVLDANRRMSFLPLLQSTVEAVTSFSTFRYPTAIADCNFTGDQIPAPSCTDDASNAQRLRVCQGLWAQNPDYYEGSDKVFTLPLNGHFLGLVEGHNPVNGAPIGNSEMWVDPVLDGFDAYAINWQYKDYDGDGNPDYPSGFLTNHQASSIGYPFMVGTPEYRTRGVINSQLVSPKDPGVTADVAIFSGVQNDGVHF